MVSEIREEQGEVLARWLLMKRGVDFTEPALPAGIWILPAMLDTMEHYTYGERLSGCVA